MGGRVDGKNLRDVEITLIHPIACPRERDISPHLYRRFVELLDERCQKAPGLQVVLTTTTPPPGQREPPTRIPKLSRASVGDLLLKRRIENLLTRVTPPLPDTSDEELP